MAINFESALGIHDQALRLRGLRSEVIANNIANSDTPGFKARDFDFNRILRREVESRGSAGAASNGEQGTELALSTSNGQHLSGNSSGNSAPGLTLTGLRGGSGSLNREVELTYRPAMQPSLDGNTVDEQTENAAFARNALEHQASFQFLNGKFTGMIKALKGE